MNLLKIMFLLIITTSAFCQSNIDSTIVANKVKEVRIFDSKNNLASQTKYDENGRIVFNSMDNFTSAMFLKTSQTNTYNENGKIIKSIQTHSSFPDEPTIWTYEYDDKQNLANIKDEKGDLVFQFFYDKTNFKNKEVMYSRNAVSQTTLFENLENGKKIIETIEGDFIKDRKNISFFDENKNEIKSESYDSGKLRFSTISVYEKNRKIKIIYIETRGKSGDNYFYDSKHRLIKRQLFDIEKKEEILGAYELFEYSKNNLIEKYTENIYSGPVLNEYRYEYNFYN